MWSSKVAFLLALALAGNACAVERRISTFEERAGTAQLVAVVDSVEPIPHEGKEFDRFYRVNARVAGVLKGDAKVDDRLEIIVDGTISELRNDCCQPGKSYVVFLREQEGQYAFVGSPLGAIPLDLQSTD